MDTNKFKKGDRLICVQPVDGYLTYDRLYVVSEVSEWPIDQVFVRLDCDDQSSSRWYATHCFVRVPELYVGDFVYPKEGSADVEEGQPYEIEDFEWDAENNRFLITFEDDAGDERCWPLEDFDLERPKPTLVNPLQDAVKLISPSETPFQDAAQDKIVSDGGSTGYYDIPEGATTLNDVIEANHMSFARGNIFKAIYRLDKKHGVDVEYDLNKIIYFAERLRSMHRKGIPL